MDDDALAYLDAEVQAEMDFKQHEEEVMTEPSPPIRTAPYLKVASDIRPTSKLVNNLWPGAYALALQFHGRRAEDAEMRTAIMTALKVAIIKGTVASTIAIRPGTIDKITATLLGLAEHRALRTDA